MEKIFTPADKVLTEIGRFVLLKPFFSGVLLISAAAITIFVANLDDAGLTEEVASVTTTIPMPLPAFPPLAVTEDTPIASPSRDAGQPPVALNPTPISESTTTSAPHWRTLTIQSGDTLSALFKREGLSAQESLAVSRSKDAKILRHLKQGQELRFYKGADGRLEQLVYAVSDKTSLNVTRSNKTYKAFLQTVPISVMLASATPAALPKAEPPVSTAKMVLKEISAKQPLTTAPANSGLHYASGRISRSLTADARKAGLSAKQANQLVQIFSPKGLVQKLRAGDEFNVLYESAQTSGSKKLSGNILAAQLVIKDKTYQLIRFTDPKQHTEYYNPQGESLQDAISRVPARFGHVSSGFSKSRLHPILGFHRPHLGVDFDAPYGTPIRAAGEGMLAEVGYKGGYGKMITIQHGGKYSTLYAHLSRFATGIREGQRISKGQIIGYVGQTGFATGAHLHYEIHVNNTPVNPMTVALPGASISKAYRNQFLMQSKMLLAQLNNNKRQIQLAQRAGSVKRS